MSTRMKRHLVTFVALLLLGSTNGIDRPAGVFKTQVEIVNDLPGGVDCTVHCKSKNDDLGFHLLHLRERFSFHFTPSFWGNTLFFCSFQWTGNFHYFDIYIQKRDSKRCVHCVWSVRPLGPCLFNETSFGYDPCYDWNPPLLS